jgi:hypothetical protein
VGDQALEGGCGVRNGVRRPVGSQQEGADVRGWRVVGSGGPEFEEVEESEGADEEGQPPELTSGPQKDQEG